MKRSYQIAERKSTRKLKRFLLESAEALLPTVELIEAPGGRSIEAAPRLSATAVAGQKRQGRFPCLEVGHILGS